MGFGRGIKNMQDFLNGFILVSIWLVATILLSVFFTDDEEKNHKHLEKDLKDIFKDKR